MEKTKRYNITDWKWETEKRNEENEEKDNNEQNELNKKMKIMKWKNEK